jgi:hypothetical protein
MTTDPDFETHIRRLKVEPPSASFEDSHALMDYLHGGQTMSEAKRIAESIVREWMLLDPTERKMDALVKAIEDELVSARVHGIRIGAATIADLRESIQSQRASP